MGTIYTPTRDVHAIPETFHEFLEDHDSTHRQWQICGCDTARKARTEDRQVEQDGLRISGDEPDLTEEEYRLLFTKSVNEGADLEAMLPAPRLPAVKDLEPMALAEHIEMLRKLSIRIRVQKQAAKVTLEAKRIHLDKKTKEELKLRESQYKPKPIPKEGSSEKKPRAKGTAKQADAIQSIMDLLGVDRETAERRLRKQELKLHLIECTNVDCGKCHHCFAEHKSSEHPQC